jgi:hypothetical protein
MAPTNFTLVVPTLCSLCQAFAMQHSGTGHQFLAQTRSLTRITPATEPVKWKISSSFVLTQFFGRRVGQ